jgi:hypothetical protein
VSYFPQVQTKLEVNSNQQLKAAPGQILKLIIHIKGKAGNWRIWDAMGMTGDTTPGTGSIVFAAQHDNPRVQEACVVDLDFPCQTAIFLEVPQGGVCSVEWL